MRQTKDLTTRSAGGFGDRPIDYEHHIAIARAERQAAKRAAFASFGAWLKGMAIPRSGRLTVEQR
jgi:hypothetical protein